MTLQKISSLRRGACAPGTVRLCRSRGGFTLVEVTLAAALAAMLLTAMGSVVLMASKALPDQSTRRAFVDQMSALNRLTADVTYATAVTGISATSIVVTVPDRDGDGRPESITYSWSGVRGEPILRQFNQGTPEALAGDIASFSLAGTTTQYANPPTYSVSAESMLASFTSILSLSRTTIKDSDWAGQVVPVSLSNGVTQFAITKIELLGRTSGSTDSVANVQIRRTRSALPNTSVLASASLPESAFGSSNSWATASFASPPVLDAGTSVCLLVTWQSGNDACDLVYYKSLILSPGGSMVTTSDFGSSWNGDTTRSLSYRLWGKTYTPNPATYQTRLCAITVKLRGIANGAERSVVVPLANQPVAP